MNASYATEADFLEHVEGAVVDNSAALDRLLRRATRDVDSVLGPMPVITTGTYAGLKLDPGDLAAYERDALAGAVSAQAVHRQRRGTDTEDGPAFRRTRVSGPDFTEEYEDAATAGTGRLSPELPSLLEPLRWRRRLVARARP